MPLFKFSYLRNFCNLVSVLSQFLYFIITLPIKHCCFLIPNFNIHLIFVLVENLQIKLSKERLRLSIRSINLANRKCHLYECSLAGVSRNWNPMILRLLLEKEIHIY